MERLQNFREDETGGRDIEKYSDERVDPLEFVCLEKDRLL